MTRYFKIVSTLLFLLIFIVGCSKESDLKSEGIELSNPSKMKDIISMFLRGHSKKSNHSKTELHSGDLTGFVQSFYDSVRWQRIMEASTYLSDTFFSSKFGDKHKYMKYLMRGKERTRVLKLNVEIKDVNLYEKEALIHLSTSGIKAYIKSGLINKTKDDVYLWVALQEGTPKIEKMIFAEKWPYRVDKDNNYFDRWMFYRIKEPSNYEFIKTFSQNLLEYIQMPHKNSNVSMYISILNMANKFSAEQLIEKERNLISQEVGGSITEKGLYKHKGYDSSFINFSYDKKDERFSEKRVYFVRWPLLYIIGAYGPEKRVKSIEKDYKTLVNSFEYINTHKSLKDSIRLNLEVSGSDVRNISFNYLFSPPVDWATVAYRDNVLQFKPIKRGVENIAYIYVDKVGDKFEGKDFIVRNEKLMRVSFKKYYPLKSEEVEIGGLKGFRKTSKFKREFFEQYTKKDQFFILKDGYMYELAMVSKSMDRDTLTKEFEKFVKGFSFSNKTEQ